MLSIHHTGMTNEDLCGLFNLLTADPEENATHAYLTCLKLGPAMQWASSLEQLASQPVPFSSETLQHLISLLEGLPELQTLQVWGLDEDQQLSVTEAWKGSKGEPGYVRIADASLRISSNIRCTVHWLHYPLCQALALA